MLLALSYLPRRFLDRLAPVAVATLAQFTGTTRQFPSTFRDQQLPHAD